MSDSDVAARMLAAGEQIEVNGQQYTLRPVCAQHLCDLELAALRTYKREYLRTISENADLLSNGRGDELVERSLREVARWTLSDLPQKDGWSVAAVPITDKLKEWVANEYGETFVDEPGERDKTSDRIRALASHALEVDRLTPETVREMTGRAPQRTKIRYDQWWATASIGGMVAMIASSLRRDAPMLSERDVAQWPFAKLVEASRIVESLSAAAVGNT